MKFFECRNCHYEFVEMPLSRYKLIHDQDPDDHKKVYSEIDEGDKADCPNCRVGILEKNVTFSYCLVRHYVDNHAVTQDPNIVDASEINERVKQQYIQHKKEKING